MRLFFAGLLAAACVGGAIPSTARAQAASAATHSPDQECDSLCRVVRTLSGTGASGSQVQKPATTATKPLESPNGAGDKFRIVASADGALAPAIGDLAALMAPGFPVESVASKGAILKDLLTLPNVDLALASSLAVARASELADRLVYIAKLFTEELHVVANADVSRLEDLDGKAVFLGMAGSDTETAAQALLSAHGVSVTAVAETFASALQGLREGRIAAVFVLAPKPFAPIAELSTADGVRLLPLPHDPDDPTFYPSTFSNADYPNLIADGDSLGTVALDTVLLAPRWRDSSSRQEELIRFTGRLLDRFPMLLEAGRHPKWQETNLAATVDGLRRLKAAQAWIAAKLKEAHAVTGEHADALSRVGEAR